MTNDKAIWEWALLNRCKVAPSRTSNTTKIFCPPGLSFKWTVKPRSRYAHDVEISHPIPTPLDAMDKTRMEDVFTELKDQFPMCEGAGYSAVTGSRLTLIDFRCGKVKPKRLVELLDFLKTTASVAMAMSRSDASETLDRKRWTREWR